MCVCVYTVRKWTIDVWGAGLGALCILCWRVLGVGPWGMHTHHPRICACNVSLLRECTEI